MLHAFYVGLLEVGQRVNSSASHVRFLGLTGGSVLLLPMRDLLGLMMGQLYCFLMRDLWRLVDWRVSQLFCISCETLEAGHFFCFSCEIFLELTSGSAVLLPMRDLLGLTMGQFCCFLMRETSGADWWVSSAASHAGPSGVDNSQLYCFSCEILNNEGAISQMTVK